jgi:hypothetical protein
VQFKNRFGAGGLLGLFFTKNLTLEGDASYTKSTSRPTSLATLATSPSGPGAVHLPLGSSYSRLIFGPGYVAARYRGDLHMTDNGFTGVVGRKLGLSRHLALR